MGCAASIDVCWGALPYRSESDGLSSQCFARVAAAWIMKPLSMKTSQPAGVPGVRSQLLDGFEERLNGGISGNQFPFPLIDALTYRLSGIFLIIAQY
jgi:hypothetical protein